MDTFDVWFYRTADVILLAYVGMENTPLYEELSWVDKYLIEECMKRYNIKKEQK